MKKIIILIALGVSSVARADGYIGLDLANARMGVACPAGQVCTQKRGGVNLRWGGALPDGYSLKVDNLSVDTVEVGFLKTGRLNASGTVTEFVRVGSTVQARSVPVSSELSAQALYAALIGRYAFDKDVSAFARVGLAYVSTTRSDRHNDLAIGSSTQNHLSPLLGLGAEYEVLTGFKINAGVQLFKVKTSTVSDPALASTLAPQSVSGTVREWTVGGRYDF